MIAGREWEIRDEESELVRSGMSDGGEILPAHSIE